MKSGVLITAVVLATGGTAAAQSTASQAPTAAPQVLSAAPPAPSAAPHAQGPEAQTGLESRRDAMRVMEGVLAASVRTGAAQVSRRIQAIVPSTMVLSGDARAHGFMIEDYGVFFDVEIPEINQSVVWSVQTLNRDREMGTSLAVLRQLVSGIADPGARQQADAALHDVEQQVGPVPAIQTSNMAVAASTDTTTAAPPNIGDPNEEYTEAVKHALIDAMLDYSGSMKLGPDEWLTVAATDSSAPLMPGQLYDAQTTILRVKGSDLSAYQTGRISREEAVKKVEIREF